MSGKLLLSNSETGAREAELDGGMSSYLTLRPGALLSNASVVNMLRIPSWSTGLFTRVS